MKMKKIFNWTFGSIFRTFGRIIAYIIIGAIAVILFSGHIKTPKISNILNDIFFMQVNAETFENGIGVITWYKDSAKNTPYTFDDIYYYNNEQSATINGANPNLTRFYGNINVSNIRGGRFEAPFLLALPLVSTNWTTTNSQLDYCIQWDYRVMTTNENVLSWDCQKFDSNSITSNDHEYQTPTVNLAVYVIYNDGNITYCNIMNDRNTITCPVPNKSTTNSVEQIVISSYVRYGGNSSQNYKIGLTNYFNTYSSDSNNIITNQNDNTQSIISNQESLTNQTIQNQNQNTQQQIDSQQVCQYIDKNNIKIKGKFLNSNGEESTSSGSDGITDYIKIEKSTLQVIKAVQWSHFLCFYNTNKIKISCIQNNSLNDNEIIPIPNNASYVRFTIIENRNLPTFNICTNGNQAMANTITDESGPSNISSLSNENMVGWLPPGPVDSLINLPLVLLNSLQNSLSSTCSPITLTLPFVNQDIYLPCMSSLYEEMGVSSFVNWAGIVASAFILFSYLMRFYKWVDNTLTFRENNWLDNWGGE